MHTLLIFLFFTSAAGADSLTEEASKTVKLIEKKILILGDSLTEGYGVEKTKAFPALFENLLKENNLNYKVLAAGTSGSTSASALKRLRWHLKANPDILILALGGNDGLRGLKPSVTKSNLSSAISLAKEKEIKVFLVGMKTPTNYGEEYRKKFEKTFTELSKEHEVFLIPFLLEGVATVKELNLSDGIHPNESGHKVIAETLFKKLNSKLK